MIDLTGKRFGDLVVRWRVGSRANGRGTTPTWLAACDCGAVAVVTGANLRGGHTKSCGCRAIRHGLYGTPEYRAYMAMVRRCVNPTNRKWRDYGGRGIAVCDRWRGRDGFRVFVEDMGPRPTTKHSLDRINNNGNYEPGNCRWATPTQQQNNKRTSRVLTVGGESASVAEWARMTGVGKSTIKERLRRGWTPDRAVMAKAGIT